MDTRDIERGKKLRELRQKAGLTARVLVHKTAELSHGVFHHSPDWLYAIETGRLALNREVACHLAKALGKEPTDLLFEDLLSPTDRMRDIYLQRESALLTYVDMRRTNPGIVIENVKDFFVEPSFEESRALWDNHRSAAPVAFQALPLDKPIWYILGPAGSGKTMMVRYLFCMLASPELDKPSLPFADQRYPIVLPLNILNDYLQDDYRLDGKPIQNLVDICEVYWQSRFPSDAVNTTIQVKTLLTEILAQGQALVMLDGVDEVSPGIRSKALHLIKQFVESEVERGNRFVITQRGRGCTRPEFYRAGGAHPSMAVLVLQPFDKKQRETLASRLLQLYRQRYAYAEEWINLQIDRFCRNIQDPILSRLASTPLILAIMVENFVHYGEVSDSRITSRPGMLKHFFRSLLDGWDRDRALNQRPTPSFHPLTVEKLLKALAWKIIQPEPTNTPELSQKALDETKVRQLFTALQDHQTAREGPNWVQDIIDFLVNAGILVRRLKKEASVPPSPAETLIEFEHDLYRDWFLAFELRQNGTKLDSYLSTCLEQPDELRWKDPVILAVWGLAVDNRDEGLLQNTIDKALKSNPLGQECDEALSGSFGKVLPLGVEFCLDFLLEGYCPPCFQTEKVLREACDRLEQTTFSVLTTALHAKILLCLDQYGIPTNRDIPRRPAELERWLAQHASTSWVDWQCAVDRIWRYQSDAQCFKLLCDHVEKHYQRAKAHQSSAALALQRRKLYRRLMFGLGFASDDSEKSKEQLLGAIMSDASQHDEVRAMAQAILESLNGPLTCPTPLPKTTKDVKALIKELALRPMREVLGCTEDRQEVLAFFRIEQEQSERERHVVEELVTILNTVAPKSQRLHPMRAVAAICLGRLFAGRGAELSRGKTPPYQNVLRALLTAATAIYTYAEEEKAYQREQFDGTVEVVQVYDYAAWALRYIFRTPPAAVAYDGLPTLPPPAGS